MSNSLRRRWLDSTTDRDLPKAGSNSQRRSRQTNIARDDWVSMFQTWLPVQCHNLRSADARRTGRGLPVFTPFGDLVAHVLSPGNGRLEVERRGIIGNRALDVTTLFVGK